MIGAESKITNGSCTEMKGNLRVHEITFHVLTPIESKTFHVMGQI